MYELLILLLVAAMALRSVYRPDSGHDDVPHKIGSRMARLWDVAQEGMRESKFLRAEKALLTILKIDEKNAAAYNRLGILYAKQKEFDDAIDCFEIATTIERTASGLHNLGLIYFETEQYEKARIAFEQAIELEDSLATRHIALAKVLERLGKPTEMTIELEKAVELEPNPESLSLLAKAYQTLGRDEDQKNIESKLKSHVLPPGQHKRIKRPSKAVV
ncbi:tetratricopeptide repeat protein [Candidatus Saccharibacteria bacterium]|nr:tetratricopeptide repeat protein [Candidatus Saccharibacteria bacterium]MCB9821527.1 tetratricopeptide repeat protein [Candidatus Nomurabacteria bacterium]